MNLHDSVRQFCSEIGKDPLLVQGAGGNVSWKENDALWIKASGTWLADASEKDIFVPVKLGQLTTALENRDFAVVPQTVEPHPLKPSIETLLHALMPQRIVVHLHAIEVLTHLVRKDFDLANYPDLDTLLNARSVEYCKPGAELAEAVAKQLDSTNSTRVVFLKNHGVIIGGDNIAEIGEILGYLTRFFATPAVNQPIIAPRQSLSLINGVEFSPIALEQLHEIATAPALVDRLNDSWALYPDHIVFLGPYPRLFATPEEAKASLEKEAELPDVIFVRGLGTFTRDKMNKAKVAQLLCYYDVMTKLNDGAKLSTLSDTQISELIDWNAEKYRRGLNDVK
ncbi:class II aldolase/adducin family protein [Pseudomonas sp. MWU12-2345]|uniref:class II aldolase/adducin family protein n=1 Tax=Pseudomonas sp. MWU12-2345 TaxID=2928689 RepID=UPI00200C8FB4|nr:class II aldolase/adducin family protein [Pseudomonas sp. MWU12-2345]